MSQVAESDAADGTLGKKNLTTMHAVAQALAIGPMFSVALILGGVSRPDIGAGWNATLAVLLAGLGVLAIAYTISLYARKYAGAGAVYEYLTHGAHPWVGVFFAGFFFVGALFLGGGGIYLGLSVLIDGFWTAHISDSGPAWWIWGMIALAIVLVLNYFGVRLAIRAMLTFAIVSFVPMLILAVVIIAKGGKDGNTLTMFDPGKTSVFGDHRRRRARRHPARHPPLRRLRGGRVDRRGVRGSAPVDPSRPDRNRRRRGGLLRAHGLRVLDRLRREGRRARARGRSRRAPSARWRRSTSARGTRRILELVVILDAMALALAICVMIGRGFFALGRDGLLPSFFAKTSKRDTPWVGNLMVAVGGIGLTLLVVRDELRDPVRLRRRGREVRPVLPERPVRDVHPLGDDRLVRDRARLPRARRWRRSGSSRSSGNKWWQYLIVLVAVATPILGFYGALNPEPHDSVELQLGRRRVDDRPHRPRR